jgi:hypothetical protein
MYPLVMVAIIAAIATVLGAQVSQNMDLLQLYRFNAQRSQLVMTAENLEQYYTERGSFPASLSALASTPGYEHVRSLLNNWQGYSVSGPLTDGVWTFQRMVAFSKDPKRGQSVSAYLAENACGIGTFAVASSWCGAKNSIWFLKETRLGFNDSITTQRARLRRSLQKFGDFYSANGEFPNKDGSGMALAAGETYRLADLVGYPGAANECTGVHTWQGLALGCDELFDSWGGAIGFVYTSKDAMSLASESPLVNASGERILVASGFTM